MQITPQLIETLSKLGFSQEDPEWAADDDFACNYRGWSVGLMVPNGGILSVSISRNGLAFSIPTEFSEELPDYDDREGHVALAQKAIDALLGPEPVQLALI